MRALSLDPAPDDAAIRRRRTELGAFLRQRRSALRPQEIGVAGLGRRHVKGLRREEVADAAAIGVSWYTMLEQGRVGRVTMRTLDAIADVLRLSLAERLHLRNLAVASFAELGVDHRPPSQALLDFVRTYSAGGAHLHSSRFDMVAWSRWSDELFGFSAAGREVNLLRLMAHSVPLRARMVTPNWLDTFRRMVGHFRIAYAAFGDAAHERLVDELRTDSPEFEQIWSHERLVVDPPTEPHLVDHPRDGRLFTMVLPFRSPSCPTYTMILNHKFELP